MSEYGCICELCHSTPCAYDCKLKDPWPLYKENATLQAENKRLAGEVEKASKLLVECVENLDNDSRFELWGEIRQWITTHLTDKV